MLALNRARDSDKSQLGPQWLHLLFRGLKWAARRQHNVSQVCILHAPPKWKAIVVQTKTNFPLARRLNLAKGQFAVFGGPKTVGCTTARLHYANSGAVMNSAREQTGPTMATIAISRSIERLLSCWRLLRRANR